MSDLDRPRLALYVALALVVCVLGARYLVAQASSPARRARFGARAGARRATAARPTATPTSVSVERAGGGRVTVHVAGAVRGPASTGCRRAPASTTRCAARAGRAGAPT